MPNIWFRVSGCMGSIAAIVIKLTEKVLVRCIHRLPVQIF
jgi:hypothetical protein